MKFPCEGIVTKDIHGFTFDPVNQRMISTVIAAAGEKIAVLSKERCWGSEFYLVQLFEEDGSEYKTNINLNYIRIPSMMGHPLTKIFK